LQSAIRKDEIHTWNCGVTKREVAIGVGGKSVEIKGRV
jgi:hypothetical protein